MITRHLPYNIWPTHCWFLEELTVSGHLNLDKFTLHFMHCPLNLGGVIFPYIYVCTHRSRQADYGCSYFDLVLILTSILVGFDQPYLGQNPSDPKPNLNLKPVSWRLFFFEFVRVRYWILYRYPVLAGACTRRIQFCTISTWKYLFQSTADGRMDGRGAKGHHSLPVHISVSTKI